MYLAGDSLFFIYEAQDYLKTPVLLLFGPMGGIFPAHSHYVYLKKNVSSYRNLIRSYRRALKSAKNCNLAWMAKFNVFWKFSGGLEAKEWRKNPSKKKYCSTQKLLTWFWFALYFCPTPQNQIFSSKLQSWKLFQVLSTFWLFFWHSAIKKK